MGGKPTGRFSNAKTPADMLVEDFGIKKLMPAYLDPNLNVEDLKTGVSFASGASGFDLLTSITAAALPLSVQLALFQQYIWKMKGLIGEEETNNIVKKSLYIVVAGSDDLCNTYYMLKIPRKIQYNVDSYTNLMVDGASNFVNDLYNMGARRIWIFGLPPIGCLPSQRMRAGGLLKICVGEYNRAALMTNAKLASKIDSLSGKLPQSELLYINIYDPLLDLIVNRDKYVSINHECNTVTFRLRYRVIYRLLNVVNENISDWDVTRDEHMGLPRKTSRKLIPPKRLGDYVWKGASSREEE
ncbi:GDSL esterase/lipase EXL3 [Capsicum chinense]|nr:GDSL esterase/lipase EXL3 [Capsicum chinense]